MRNALLLVSLLLLTLVPAAAGGNIITGADAGGGPLVNVFDGNAQTVGSFLAYDQAFSGGVRVAAGDVNGDGVADVIVGAGAGASGGHVKVFDGNTGAEIRSFLAFQGFSGGIFVGSGDVNGDGFDDIIVGSGAGAGGHIKVFDGRTGAEIRSFFAFQGFIGGTNVGAGDVNGDGRADIIVGASVNGHVKAFSGRDNSLLRSFFAFPGFNGGVFVGAADLDGDGRADIITGAGAGAPPHVKVFSAGIDQTASFFAYSAGFLGGVRVAAGDVNGDGRADIITAAGAGGGPHVKAFDGRSTAELASFFAFGPSFTGGLFVAGALKGATDRIPDLHGLVTSFKVSADLDTYLHNAITDAQRTLPAPVCTKLNKLLYAAMDKSGKTRQLFAFGSAQRLSVDTNSILIGLGCVSSTSPLPGVERDLIGLLQTTSSMELNAGLAGILIGLLRDAGDAAIGNDRAGTLKALDEAIAVVNGGHLTAPQMALLLPAIQKVREAAGKGG